MQQPDHRATFASLLNGREVFVYAREFGPAYPVLTGPDACLPFFRPWEVRSRCHYLNGRIGIASSLMELIAMDHLPALRAAFSAKLPARARAMPWPDSIFPALMAGDTQTAEAMLRQPHANVARVVGIGAWLQAATYWAKAFQDRAMTRHCLDHFRDMLLDPDIRFLKTRAHFRTWVDLQDNRDEVLAWLYEAMRLCSLDDAQVNSWVHLGIVFAEHFEDPGWSRYCLERAAAKGESKATLATVSASILSTKKKLSHPGGRDAACTPNELLKRSYFFHLIAKQPARAKRQLEMATANSHDSLTDMAIAGGWLLLFDDRKAAARLAHQAKSRDMDAYTSLECAAANADMLGDTLSADLCFLEASATARDSGIVCDVAGYRLDTLKDESGCNILLRHSEDLAVTSAEFCHCADAWLRQVGNAFAAKRCLRKAIRHALCADQRIACATTAIRLFNDIATARRLMSHPPSTHP